MFYFKTVKLQETDSNNIEKGIRVKSLKRYTSLDLQSSASYITSNQSYFIGLESTKYLKLTRIRTPFERIFPKLILRFDKQNFNSLQIRWSIFSTIIFSTLIFAIVTTIIFSINSGKFNDSILILAGFTLIYITLTFVEFKLTMVKVKKAINDIKSQTISKTKLSQL